MGEAPSTVVMMRRAILRAVAVGSAGVFGGALYDKPSRAAANDIVVNETALIKQLTGGVATPSPLVHLAMPRVFGNGYSVPLSLMVDSPMTDTDHVRFVHVIAPKNPITTVARFEFGPGSGRAEISTRVRLSQPQNVLAVAAMSDGNLLMAKTWVEVKTDGCA